MTDGQIGESDELLRGLVGQARRERSELIDWLLARGFDRTQIPSVLVPMLLPANRLIGDDGTRVSMTEVCAISGIDSDLLVRLHRAVSLPASDGDTVALKRADATSVLGARAFVDLGFDVDDVVAIVRVVAEGLGRAAETMRAAALKAVLRPGATEIQLAEAFEEMAQRLAPAVASMVTDLLHLQLRRSWETEAISLAERAAGSLPTARRMSVAFADIVGFTELGETVDPEQLERIALRLADVTQDVIEPPVRYVKSIGDAVMLVSADAPTLVGVVLDLVDQAARHDLPPLRAGVASGQMASHAGDWYGSPVNLASRITGSAAAGTVVVTDAVRSQTASDEFVWTSLGARTVKGVVGQVPLYTARRRSEPDTAG